MIRCRPKQQKSLIKEDKMADQILCGGQVFDSLFYSLGDDCETMRTSLILKINSLQHSEKGE